MKNPSPYTTTSSRIAFSCPWYQVRQDEIVTPDGKPGVYNVVVANPAVWIVPVTAVAEIVLIHTYRYTIDAWCWEVPAGGIKPGQTAEETAVAELREEIGGIAAHYDYIAPFYTANGFSNEVGHYFLATGVELSAPTAHESTEVMTIHPTPIADALHMARSGQISDGPSALALLLAEPKLRQLFPGKLL